MHANNLVVLRGHLSSAPRRRELPSGSVLVHLEVTTRPPGDGPGGDGPGGDGPGGSAGRTDDAGATVSVPVVWFDPPTGAGIGPDTPVGTAVVVVGQVRRRFFRAGGTTQSRTEVVADAVVRSSRERSVERTVARAVSALAGPRS